MAGVAAERLDGGALRRLLAAGSSTARARRGTPGRLWIVVAAVLAGHAAFFTAAGLNSESAARATAQPAAILYLDLTPSRAGMPKVLRRPPPQPAGASPARPAPSVLPRRPAHPEAAAPAEFAPPRESPQPAPASPPPTPAPRAPTEALASRAALDAVAPPAQDSTPSPEFQRKVLAALERVRRYPPAARARREEGVVVVSFTLSRSGRVLFASVLRSSGSSALDRAALETVRRAALPAVPADFTDPLTLVVPVAFSIRPGA